MTSNGGANYTYNGESQLATAGGATYTYDGDGNRVKKSSGTLYWGSGPLVESDLNGTASSLKEYIMAGGRRIARRDNVGTGNVFFYLSDNLGSSREIVASGASSACYGGERAYTNTCPQNYKFTGKERDSESGLDNFGARYDSSNLGRFMTPDWSEAPEPAPYADFGDPQTLNQYGYVRNNPVVRADLDGHGWWDDFTQRWVNSRKGLGWRTSKEVTETAATGRKKLVDKGLYNPNTGEITRYTKDSLSKMSDAEVVKAVDQYSDAPPASDEDINKINQALQAAAAIEPFTRDATGRIHGSLPDRIPDNWSRAELEHARDELRESIKSRIKVAAEHGGPNAGH